MALYLGEWRDLNSKGGFASLHTPAIGSVNTKIHIRWVKQPHFIGRRTLFRDELLPALLPLPASSALFMKE